MVEKNKGKKMLTTYNSEKKYNTWYKIIKKRKAKWGGGRQVEDHNGVKWRKGERRWGRRKMGRLTNKQTHQILGKKFMSTVPTFERL